MLFCAFLAFFIKKEEKQYHFDIAFLAFFGFFLAFFFGFFGFLQKSMEKYLDIYLINISVT
jgi:hypothetical protein